MCSFFEATNPSAQSQPGFSWFQPDFPFENGFIFGEHLDPKNSTNKA